MQRYLTLMKILEEVGTVSDPNTQSKFNEFGEIGHVGSLMKFCYPAVMDWARLWKSVKYEEVYLKVYGSIAEARKGLERLFS
jgi:hypothetical protein